MNPTPTKTELLLGHARSLWENDLKRWRNGSPFHLIFYGPPGCGKTSLCKLLMASYKEGPKFVFSAVRDSSKDIVQTVRKYPGAIIFVDEIHRFSKSQQDIFLPILENNEAVILGATTEPPSVRLNKALLSRIQIFKMESLDSSLVEKALLNAIDVIKKRDDVFPNANTLGLENYIERIVKLSQGDLRLAYQLLERATLLADGEDMESCFQNVFKEYSKNIHYDLASAMIKSMRGSEPDAALFYALCSIELGEDPLFVFRRCLIFASEDIGNADPYAVTIANSTYEVFLKVGMPEGTYALSHLILYLSTATKSNSVLRAINQVKSWIKETSTQESLFKPPSKLTLKGHKEYKYPHNYEGAFVKESYLPEFVEKLREKSGRAYLPSSYGHEKKFQERLKALWGKL